MADEDEEYSYVPNSAVMGAVQASGGLQTGHVQGASGLGPAYSSGPPSDPNASYLSSLRPKQRAAAAAAIQRNQATMSHNSALEAVARAHLALEQTNSFYNNAKTRNELVQQANQLNQSAGFLAEHANLNPYSPDYYKHVNALAAKYPGAADNKIVQGIVANPKLREQAALKGDLPGEVMTQKALQAGWLKPDDFNNPRLVNQDGSVNHDAAAVLAGMREGASVEPPHIKTARTNLEMLNKAGTDLTPQQEQLRDISTNQILQFEKGRQAALGVAQPTPVSAASFLPRTQVAAPQPAAAPVTMTQQPVAPAPQQSIPPAPPPPTPAPQPISPDKATEYLKGMGINVDNG